MSRKLCKLYSDSRRRVVCRLCQREFIQRTSRRAPFKLFDRAVDERNLGQSIPELGRIYPLTDMINGLPGLGLLRQMINLRRRVVSALLLSVVGQKLILKRGLIGAVSFSAVYSLHERLWRGDEREKPEEKFSEWLQQAADYGRVG
jgi:hypothetical protein